MLFQLYASLQLLTPCFQIIFVALEASLLHAEAGRDTGAVLPRILHRPQLPQAEGRYRFGSVRAGGLWPAAGESQAEVSVHVRYQDAQAHLLPGC